MSLGVAFVNPLPTPGVTTSPTYESMLDAFLQEAKAKLEAKVADADILLTGADVHHGARQIELGAAGGSPYNVGTPSAYNVAGYWLLNATNNEIHFSLPVELGQRIVNVTMYGRAGTAGWTVKLDTIDKTTGTQTTIASSSSASPAVISGVTLTPIQSVASGVAYVLRFVAGDPTHRCYGFTLTVDRP